MDEPPRRFLLGAAGCDIGTGSRVVVFLDGEKQTDLIGWDCDAGYVEKWTFDLDGAPMVYGEINEEGEVVTGSRPIAVTEKAYGLVEVRWIGG